MFEQSLPERTRRYLALLAEKKISQPFHLAGGTALALHLGHRLSFDLDFFTCEHFSINALEESLQEVGSYARDRIAEDTLLGSLEDLRVSFFRYRYKNLESPILALGTNFLQLSDLAAMKIEAVAQRNLKRDFVDLYFLAQEAGILPEHAIEYHRQKYEGLHVNLTHIILSLGYFDDADNDDMPPMLKPVIWEDIRKYFSVQSRELMKKFKVS